MTLGSAALVGSSTILLEWLKASQVTESWENEERNSFINIHVHNPEHYSSLFLNVWLAFASVVILTSADSGAAWNDDVAKKRKMR